MDFERVGLGSLPSYMGIGEAVEGYGTIGGFFRPSNWSPDERVVVVWGRWGSVHYFVQDDSMEPAWATESR